jgi:hypothetical protein
MTKYPYKYNIITKDGKTITDRMNAGKPLNTSSRSKATKVLKIRFPGCVVTLLETKTKKHFDNSVGQFANSIFL